MNLETKITIYKFTPQVFTLTRYGIGLLKNTKRLRGYGLHPILNIDNESINKEIAVTT